MRRTVQCLMLCGALLPIAACSAPEGSAPAATVFQTVSVTPTPSSGPSETPSIQASVGASGTGPDQIKRFDFKNVKWFDAPNGRTVHLKKGRAHTKGVDYSLDSRERVYADVDGDGVDDALVSILAEEGNGFTESTYLWVWNAKIGAPKQVRQPVENDMRCGDVTQSITAARHRITVRYLNRMTFTGPCSEQPTKRSTKKITLKDGFLYETAPQVSALTPCGEGTGTEGFTPAEFTAGNVLAAPDTRAPVVATDKTVKLYDEATDQSGVPDGWFKVMYVPAHGAYDYLDPPCGFVKVDSDG
jgi:hypothetical protein